MTTSTALKIGIIICSQRKPRVGDQIAAYVLETLESSNPQSSTAANQPISFTLIDLLEWNLPLFDEPVIPSKITHHSQYAHSHSQAWSIEVQRYDAFIFVTPQYNWGYPASVKNAIDYLFNEWNGKPAMIVSYGGHGGSKSAQQLRQVLCGVRMKPTETMPALTFPGQEVIKKAVAGDDLGISGEEGIWKTEREVIRTAFAELLGFFPEKE